MARRADLDLQISVLWNTVTRLVQVTRGRS
jgi:hypothetical protein